MNSGMRLVFSIIVFSAFSHYSWSQILPKEGSLLNFRIVGLSFPAEKDADNYKVEIASGDIDARSPFESNIIQTLKSDKNQIVADVAEFGGHYTWRVVSYRNKVVVKTSPFHHFVILNNARIDTTKLRLKVSQGTDKFNDMYIAVDGGGVFYDFGGRPICFVPDTNGLSGYVADIQFTPQSTLTFIHQRDAFEVTLAGGILWKAPNTGDVGGDKQKGEIYHHEFKKLENGHYMILGTELFMCKPVSTADSSYILVSRGVPVDRESVERLAKEGYARGKFGTLIEYDQNGNVVWTWKSSEHLLGSDFDYYTNPNIYERLDPHENTFWFDNKKNIIYLGYRNLNRVIEIEYPGGRILNTYGDAFKAGTSGVGTGLFCNIHGISISKGGNLYYFNNNSCRNTDSMPTVIVLQKTGESSSPLKKVWEFTCPSGENAPQKFASGGNALELDDGSFLVNMGSDYSKLFVVTRDKKILWSAIPERFIETDKKWVPMKEYRVNMISRADLESLIWYAEKYSR